MLCLFLLVNFHFLFLTMNADRAQKYNKKKTKACYYAVVQVIATQVAILFPAKNSMQLNMTFHTGLHRGESLVTSLFTVFLIRIRLNS